MIKANNKNVLVVLGCVLITIIAGFPMFASGVCGHLGDLTYHLLRIESVKEAMVAGSFPPRVNPLFLEGYGYGSSLFYPDIFLVIPALLNLIGISPTVSYEIFVFMIILAATFTTYYAMKFFCGNYECALLGTGVLMLSTFYLADIHNRSGMSEIMACVFMPLMMIGIYDYFVYEGKKVYLLGVAFGGMALSHTIMTFIGILLTAIIFVGMLIIPSKRRLVFERKRFGRLLLTALLTILAVSYYIFPMLEQMANNRFWFNEPWAQVGKYIQPFESFFVPVGHFYYNAKFGVGVPVFVLLSGRVFLGKVKSRWADCFIVFGVLLFVIMTDPLFWIMMQDNIMNMIQFPYRFYPYALFMIICGMTIILTEKRESKQVGKEALICLAILTVLCGFWQEKRCAADIDNQAMDTEYLYANTCNIGRGEWVPEGVTEEVFIGEAVDTVLAEDKSTLELTTVGYSKYQFEVDGTKGCCFVAPLLYYKGYEAVLMMENGQQKPLEVSKSRDGLVEIRLDEKADGAINVWYEGTTVQKVSNVISFLVILGIFLMIIVFKFRKNECKESMIEGEHNDKSKK